MNLLGWVSVRTIKETFSPPTTVGYPFMAEQQALVTAPGSHADAGS